MSNNAMVRFGVIFPEDGYEWRVIMSRALREWFPLLPWIELAFCDRVWHSNSKRDQPIFNLPSSTCISFQIAWIHSKRDPLNNHTVSLQRTVISPHIMAEYCGSQKVWYQVETGSNFQSFFGDLGAEAFTNNKWNTAGYAWTSTCGG